MKIDLPGDGYIIANDIQIGENVKFGNGVKINVRNTFSVGSDSYIGDRFSATGENITIGSFFFNAPTDSRGMVIGGGSSNFPYANLTIGDRCVCHTGHINIARPVTIGNDVGLSHDVDIITHGFWASVFEGYPNIFADVSIGNNVIVGWKSIIMGGVTIADNVVIGAHSTVVKSLDITKGIYAGTPAKYIKTVELPKDDDKKNMLSDMCMSFKELLSFYDAELHTLSYEYPKVHINDLVINVETSTCEGTHDLVTDAFRDYIRRYGVRVFTSGRSFGFKIQRKSL